jgi:hypothetical protein
VGRASSGLRSGTSTLKPVILMAAVRWTGDAGEPTEHEHDFALAELEEEQEEVEEEREERVDGLGASSGRGRGRDDRREAGFELEMALLWILGGEYKNGFKSSSCEQQSSVDSSKTAVGDA